MTKSCIFFKTWGTLGNLGEPWGTLGNPGRNLLAGTSVPEPTNPKCGFYKSKKYSFYKIPIIGITKSFKKNEKDWNNFFNINGFNCKN